MGAAQVTYSITRSGSCRIQRRNLIPSERCRTLVHVICVNVILQISLFKSSLRGVDQWLGESNRLLQGTGWSFRLAFARELTTRALVHQVSVHLTLAGARFQGSRRSKTRSEVWAGGADANLWNQKRFLVRARAAWLSVALYGALVVVHFCCQNQQRSLSEMNKRW